MKQKKAHHLVMAAVKSGHEVLSGLFFDNNDSCRELGHHKFDCSAAQGDTGIFGSYAVGSSSSW